MLKGSIFEKFVFIDKNLAIDKTQYNAKKYRKLNPFA